MSVNGILIMPLALFYYIFLEERLLTYYVIASLTLFSALVGMYFAIMAIRDGVKVERTNAIYMFSRSVATVIIAAIPLFQKSAELLIIGTIIMLIVQLIDGIGGMYIKDRLGTVGPLILVVIHSVCLCVYVL